MLMIVTKTKHFDDIKEKDLIALLREGECVAYCVLFLKLISMVLLEFDEDMKEKLIAIYGENIPFDFEILGV